MGRSRAVMFTLLSGAITALVLWLLPQSEGADRTFALGAALFFGACTLVPLSHLFPARLPAEEADGSVTILNSKARSLTVALALVMVTAAALLMWPIISQDGDWRKFVFLLIPAPCAFLALKYLQWSGQPAFRFDRQGVTRYQWGTQTTPWDVVTGVRRVDVRGAQHVVLDVTPAYRRQFGWWRRLGAATGFGDLTLPSGATGLTPSEIEALVRRFWNPAARAPAPARPVAAQQ